MELATQPSRKSTHKAKAKTKKQEKKGVKKIRRSSISAKLYLYLLLQLLALVVAFMYMAFTITMYPLNYIWVVVFLMVTIVGFVRGFLAALIGAMFVIFGYGSFLLYELYVAETTATIAVNDLFWIVSFPIGAFISGLLGNELITITQNLSFYKKSVEELVTIDGITGLPNERQFRMELSREISRSRRYGHSLTVLMVEIAYYQEMLKDYGKESTETLLRQIGEQIEAVLRDEDKKAYLENGVFGVILPETKVERVELVIRRMNEQMKTYRLELQKGNRQIEVQMRYGYAGCPENYESVNELFEEAKRMLDAYVG